MLTSAIIKLSKIKYSSITFFITGFMFLCAVNPSHSEVIPPLFCSSVERAVCSSKNQNCTSGSYIADYSIIDLERNVAFSDCDEKFQNCQEEWVVQRNQFTSIPYPGADRKILLDIYFLRHSRHSDYVKVLQIHAPEVSTEDYQYAQSMLGSSTSMITHGTCYLDEKP